MLEPRATGRMYVNLKQLLIVPARPHYAPIDWNLYVGAALPPLTKSDRRC